MAFVSGSYRHLKKKRMHSKLLHPYPTLLVGVVTNSIGQTNTGKVTFEYELAKKKKKILAFLIPLHQ